MKLWGGRIFHSHALLKLLECRVECSIHFFLIFLSNSCNISLNTNFGDTKYYNLGGHVPSSQHLLDPHLHCPNSINVVISPILPMLSLAQFNIVFVKSSVRSETEVLLQGRNVSANKGAVNCMNVINVDWYHRLECKYLKCI